MYKTLSRLVLGSLVISVSVLFAMILWIYTDDSTEKKYEAEAKSYSVLIGSFMEHIISERLERLQIVGSISDSEIRHRAIAEYAQFIRKHYDFEAGFSVGEVNRFFQPVRSVDDSMDISRMTEYLPDSLKTALLSGEIYLGSFRRGFRADTPDEYLIMIPLMSEEGFSGAVFDLFRMSSSEMYGSVWQNGIAGARTELVILSEPKLAVSGETRDMLNMRQTTGRDVVSYKGAKVAFYTFNSGGTDFCLIYRTSKINKLIAPACCPWLEQYMSYIIFMPVVFLFTLIILEIARKNRNLGMEVMERSQRLENLKTKYESIFKTIPEYLVLYQDDGQIIDKNKKFLELIKDGSSRMLYDVVKEREKFIHEVKSIPTGIVENMGEYTLMKDDGTSVNVAVSTTRMHIRDGSALLTSFTDLTEFKRAHRSFYQDQKREEVGTLAAGMAHDFGNILQNIAFQYSLADRTDDTEKRGKHLESISAIVEGARLYLDGVLKSTKSSEKPSVVMSGSALTKNAIEITGHILPSDVSIEYSDKSGESMIKMNESRYIQLIVNLCQNASDAMDNRGVIRITTDVEEKAFGRFFRLSVRDTGKGIKPEEIKNIFRPFYTTKGKGTGLGLATVKQVVIDCGGMVDVVSTQGDGCEFIIMIPESK
ncbi:MAG: nitrogen regulation protein NR(II) [Deferribacterales bacterium]